MPDAGGTGPGPVSRPPAAAPPAHAVPQRPAHRRHPGRAGMAPTVAPSDTTGTPTPPHPGPQPSAGRGAAEALSAGPATRPFPPRGQPAPLTAAAGHPAGHRSCRTRPLSRRWPLRAALGALPRLVPPGVRPRPPAVAPAALGLARRLGRRCPAELASLPCHSSRASSIAASIAARWLSSRSALRVMTVATAALSRASGVHRADASDLAASDAASASALILIPYTRTGYLHWAARRLDQLRELLLSQRRMRLPVTVLPLFPAAPRVDLMQLRREHAEAAVAVDHRLLLRPHGPRPPGGRCGTTPAARYAAHPPDAT